MFDHKHCPTNQKSGHKLSFSSTCASLGNSTLARSSAAIQALHMTGIQPQPSVQCDVCTVMFLACSVQCVVCSVQCLVCSVQGPQVNHRDSGSVRHFYPVSIYFCYSYCSQGPEDSSFKDSAYKMNFVFGFNQCKQ